MVGAGGFLPGDGPASSGHGRLARGLAMAESVLAIVGGNEREAELMQSLLALLGNYVTSGEMVDV